MWEQIWAYLPVYLAVLIIVVFLVYLSILAHRRKVETGAQGIKGEEGIYRGGGKVFVHGELWAVESEDNLSEGDKVIVEGVERMTLRVKKV